MVSVKLYITSHCPYCTRAKNFLHNKGIKFEVIDLTHKPDELRSLKQQTHWQTVPQIFIGTQFIGGYSDMVQLDREGELDVLLSGKAVQN